MSKEFLQQLSLSELRDSDLQVLPVHWSISLSEGKLFLDTQGDKSPELLRHCQLAELEILCQKNHENNQWIQLIGLDHGDESCVSQDPLEYFFDNQVDILDQHEKNKKNAGYRVLKSKPDERQLLLCRKEDKHRNPVFPKERQLRVKVNTQALWQQKEAITRLKLGPTLDQKPLIDLLKGRDKQYWPAFEPVSTTEIGWSILKDAQFDGCDKQREFVAKALATPDFAILDGPPGTGKTTTILELIVQMVRQGKRILLTASTHAAINNVLERVDSHGLTDEIFPLRIGDENRAIGVEHYQYDKLRDTFSDEVENNEIDQLLVDSSNLVCGTTMGILRLFNNNALRFESGVPPFDVMIIDECSKTTFAEFLVPARYAKRWVLVGDIKQLSPFTDREQITANLKQLVLQHKNRHQDEITLKPEIQRACFLLNELRSRREEQWGYHDKLVIPASSAELDAIHDEIAARSSDSKHSYESVCLVGCENKTPSANSMTINELNLTTGHFFIESAGEVSSIS